MAEPQVTFAGLLRKLRTEARWTQAELAEATGLSPRSISDLERGIAATPRRDTVRLLADGLHLAGPARAEFEAVARGRPVPAGTGAAAAATRTLPRDVASFTGRQHELLELVDAANAEGSSGVVGIHAIGGMAGVGKTAFAVHAAHRLADRFPAGQIFLPLHGHTPGQQPVDPADALASLLLTLGVPAGQIPPGLEARMALWRDRVAGRQLLLVLDDAASSEQVLPLLPGSGGNLVLVTSRRHLSALDDATAISLDTLPPGEAAALLAQLADRSGLGADDPAVAEIIRLCGYLPLAIGMVARQLHHHPAWSLAGRAAELASAVDRLDLMTTENLSVAAAFDLSYEDLTPGQQRLFRRLGLHPGTDIDAHAAAALDGADVAAVRRGLEALYDQYLLTEVTQGRYRLHDLIREHARALADRFDSGDERDLASARLLNYYQHTAARANTFLARQTRTASSAASSAASSTADGSIPAAVPALASREHALAWARAERTSMLACLDQATRAGQHARVVALTAGLAGLLRQDGPWAEAIARHSTALRAAGHLGDRTGQAGALNDLGHVRQLTGDYPAATGDLEEALGIYRDLGDRLGQANAQTMLGFVRVVEDNPGASRDLEEALGIYRDLGDQLGQANALTFLGDVRLAAGDFQAAARGLEEALSISRDIGDLSGQARALSFLADARRLTGNLPGAAQAQVEALDIYRDLGDRHGQARALNNLGNIRRTTGDYQAAARDQVEALVIYRDLGDRLGQANALHSLGHGRWEAGDFPAAGHALEEALGIYRDLGSRHGQANCFLLLGGARRDAGDYPAADRALEEALGIYRDLGSRHGQANTLLLLAGARRGAGDYPAAGRALEEALGIYRDLGARSGEVDALNEAGTLHRVLGDLDQAVSCHRQALDLARQIDSSRDEAHALAGLGRCALVAGRTTEAEDKLRLALEIFQRLGAAETADLTAELDAMRAAAQPASDDAAS